MSGETGESWTGAMLRDAVAFGFAEALGADLSPGEPTPAEQTIAAALVGDKYRTDEWLFARTPHADATATSVLKTPGGLVRLYVALQGDTIKSALFTGDFNDIPEPIVRFESELKWARLDHEDIEAVAERAFAKGTGLGVEPGVLVDAILGAGERAANREFAAAPTREGSCYFPDSEATT